MDDARISGKGFGGGGKLPTSFHHHHHHGDGHHHHHHHFFYVSPHCPLHRSILQPNNHAPSCSFSTYYSSPQNPNPIGSTPSDPNSSFLITQPDQEIDDAQRMMEDETEKLEIEEDEEEPIFVLTDEWRDFFAKSEAKRRLAKKQAKKGKN